MHIPAKQGARWGAYSNPFSGIGQTFFPLSVQQEPEPFTLHEAGYVARRHDWNYPSVFSPFWRLNYDFQRGHKVIFRDKEVFLGPDRILLIPDHQFFHCQGQEPRPHFWLHFSCARRVSPDQPIPIELPVRRSELDVMKELTELIGSRHPGKHKNRILHASLALLHLTLSQPGIRWLEHKPDKLRECLEYIEKHYGEPLSNRDLALMFRMSERSFMSMFEHYQGISPAQYIRQMRVRAASDLLLHTQKSLDEIAEAVGLGTRNYLTRVFTQVTGESPARFRRTQAES